MSGLSWPFISVMIGGFIIALLAVYILKIRRELKSGYPLRDERTEKIAGKAAIGTYYVTSVFLVTLLLWMIFSTEVPSLPEIDTGYTLVAVILVMGLSNGALNWFYARREGRLED